MSRVFSINMVIGTTGEQFSKNDRVKLKHDDCGVGRIKYIMPDLNLIAVDWLERKNGVSFSVCNPNELIKMETSEL